MIDQDELFEILKRNYYELSQSSFREGAKSLDAIGNKPVPDLASWRQAGVMP